MALPSKFEDASVRFGPYIDELHEFFALRGLHFGAPQDIFPLTARLSNSAFFRDEMSSMIRAIIYRERESVTREELLELVAVAIGGPHVDQSAQDLHQPVQQILDFLGGAFRSLWQTFPDELDDSEVSHGPFEAPPVTVVALATPSQAPPAGELIEKSRPEPQPISNWAPNSSNGILSRALTMSDAGDSVQAPKSSSLFWIAVICVFMLSAAGGVLLRVQTSAHHSVSPVTQSGEESEASPALPSAPSENPRLEGESLAQQHAQDSASTGPAPGSPGNTPQPEYSQPARSREAFQPHTRSQPIAPESSLSLRSRSSAFAQPNSGSGAHVSPGQSVFFVSSGLMTGNLLSAPEPHYPRLASLMHVEGPVILQAVVAPDGSVSATRVLGGHMLLRGAAEDAVRHWRYRPYIIDGRPTDVATIITLDFRLHH